MTTEQAERVRDEIWKRHNNAEANARQSRSTAYQRSRAAFRRDAFAEVLALMATEERR
jgi:hypothetical protein